MISRFVGNDGIWDLVDDVIGDKESSTCRSTGCTHKPVAIWASYIYPEVKWPVCESCQLDELGGWSAAVAADGNVEEGSKKLISGGPCSGRRPRSTEREREIVRERERERRP